MKSDYLISWEDSSNNQYIETYSADKIQTAVNAWNDDKEDGVYPVSAKITNVIQRAVN